MRPKLFISSHKPLPDDISKLSPIPNHYQHVIGENRSGPVSSSPVRAGKRAKLNTRVSFDSNTGRQNLGDFIVAKKNKKLKDKVKRCLTQKLAKD